MAGDFDQEIDVGLLVAPLAPLVGMPCSCKLRRPHDQSQIELSRHPALPSSPSPLLVFGQRAHFEPDLGQFRIQPRLSNIHGVEPELGEGRYEYVYCLARLGRWTDARREALDGLRYVPARDSRLMRLAVRAADSALARPPK